MAVVRNFFLGICLFLLPLSVQCEESGDNSSVYIHQIFEWPNFCFSHLEKDPEGCSSWTWGYETEYKLILEETSYTYYPYAYFPKELIQSTSSVSSLVPCVENSTCDYAHCTLCKKTVVRTTLYETRTHVWDEESGDYINCVSSYIAYICGCLQEFINKDDPEYAEIVKNWQFCKQSAIYPGYFDKYLSTYFTAFKDYLKYCSENKDCTCYWVEKSEAMRSIASTIVTSFNNYFFRDDIEAIFPSEFDTESLCKFNCFPYRKLADHTIHSVFYSQLLKSLPELDVTAFFNFKHPSFCAEEFKTFNKELLLTLRPKFWELYRSCYAKHPHPKIAQEIELIEKEMRATP